jgi:hypothetical protein
MNNASTAACPQFVEFAKATCSKLEDQGYWADYIDPCSGLPMIHRCDSGFGLHWAAAIGHTGIEPNTSTHERT